MNEKYKERKVWSESDRAMAYVLFRASKFSGVKIGDKQCREIARSRKVVRTDGSWSSKLNNYLQAYKFITGETSEPIYTGNSEKKEFPELDTLWKKDRDTVLRLASQEIVVRDKLALDFLGLVGFDTDKLKVEELIDFTKVTKENVLGSLTKYSKGERPDGFKESTDYDVLHELKRFPPKVIMAIAYKIATGEIISGAMFEGGRNTPCFKRFVQLGFQIVSKAKSNSYIMHISDKLNCTCSAKPFTIIAGGTGTGKTRSARLAAVAIAGKTNVEIVAVGADWTDNRQLLGFFNLLSVGGKTYVAPPTLRIILKALDNPGKPYFLILDEMNLSHVERYFADFLSSMESKEPLKLHDSAEPLKTEDGVSVPGKIAYPNNLFVIGTVNIDETTYMFSPKVLDRAHVIEFKVTWDEIANGLEGAVPTELPALRPEQVDEFMRVSHLTEKTLSEEDHDLLTDVLEDLHAALEGTRFVFAHRTARECLNLIASAQALAKAEIIAPQETTNLIDLAILQKALPKLNGASGTLSKVLEELIKVSDKHDLERCKEKLESMSRQLKADQFVSFIQ
jgi:hypothetical protein